MRYSWCKTIEMKNRNQVRSYNEEVFKKEFEKSINDACAPFKKEKRFRSAFTTEQVNYLEKEFRKYPYIGTARRKDVSNVLNIPERAVKIWFQNRRMKEKKDSAKETDDKLENNNNQVDTSHEITKIDNSSLPLLIAPESPLTNTYNEGLTDASTKTTHTKDNSAVNIGKYYKDIFPERETSNESMPNNSKTVLKNNPASVTKSAKFPIELLNNYKAENLNYVEDKQINDRTKTNEETRDISSFNHRLYKPEHVSSHFSASFLPQDLSSKSTQQQPKTINRETSHSQQNLDMELGVMDQPLYLKGFYAQPYVPPGNMIWKPINVAPMIPAPLPMALPNPGSAGQSTMKRNCTCDCHVKPAPLFFQQNTPQPNFQYVITALPFSNQIKYA